MRDQTDESTLVSEILESDQSQPQDIRAKTSKALVNEHRINPDAADTALGLIRKTERKGKGSKESFSSGKTPHRAFSSAVMIQDADAKTGLAPFVSRLFLPHQVILAIGHLTQPPGCLVENTVEEIHLGKCLQIHFLLSIELSTESLEEIILPGKFIHDGLMRAEFGLNPPKH